MSRQWQTERPRATTKTSLLGNPKLTRNATNVSALNAAIWDSPRHDDDSTSSSSDNETDDDAEGNKKHGRRGRGKKDRGYSRFNVGNENFHTRGRVRKDGRLTISVNETNNRGYLAKALGATFGHFGPFATDEMASVHQHHLGREQPSRASSESTITSDIPRPRLNIVVMVIGSRGDIQPFLKLGKNLKEYGHRVRIATHPAFKDFVQNDSGLEFFSVGGNPAELMAFMVKNPGMIPTMDTLKKGEVGRRRDQMAEMFEGFWRACINATDDEKDVSNLKMMGEKAPFIADAIIANPPSFAHIHCAERLGIPLHLMFTFPYTPTQAFPHPLANVKKSNVDPGYANFMSYPLVEMMTWQGLGDLINNFRVKTLGLEPVSTLWAPGQLYRLKVPYTYLWSPGLIPKPKDWGPEIDIAGFVFLDLASSFEPPEDLVKFLDTGEPPVYIGFGSIVVDDPDKFTKMIFEAVEKAGVRALVSKGWGGLGDDDNTPDNIYMLENTPHDWLFPKVSAVVHHGGAGTTAIGLKCGKPTMIVPFFGDQQFWGAMIGEAGAGAKPIPYKSLTADKLAEGIKQCLTDEARKAAEKIASDIEAEGDGAKNAVISFHRSLVLRGQQSMRCSMLEDRVAVWNLKNTSLRLSALAAELLVEKKKITWKQLRLIRHNEWNDFEGPGEPLTGGATAIMGTVTGIATGIGSVPFKIAKSSKKRARHEEKKQRKSQEASRRRSGEKMDNGKQHQDDKQNGKPISGNSQDQTDSTQDKEQKVSHRPDISTTRSRGTGSAASDPGMGKHTIQGEPVQQKHDAENEHKQRDNDDDDDDSELSDDPEENAIEEMAHNVGSGVGKTAEAIARSPMDLSLAIAQGFHNAPRLYGDSTVRRPTRITGVKSGFKAAGEEFAFGIYDGVTGIVRQPYTGARDNGAFGFVKGVGMGLTGFVLKDLAAIIGPVGYTFKGFHKQLLKHKQPTNFIRKARILEGQRDLNELDEKAQKEVMDAVCHGWSVVQQIWAVMEEEKRASGLGGRLRVMRERKTWRANGAFENVTMAERALEAKRNGESLEGVFAQQRVELANSQRPRKNVVKDLEQGNGNEVDADAQHIQKNGKARAPTKETPDILGRA
ncbi:UDP-Glycosyltransferase/glycogen phosphorylase [Mollisia scopiformis]|uniref:UDP-Glycosyltransferase/glycogen phosphorylase n=1 Tax=Mollisia scopiformis TaxID=149040 RepID=A0A194XSA7_MOLSC|nr:UDP-Glycosyltransferase/glycogen phosphorylase [Mollisia scopiformis]KUJ23026.1 UDP-Glycosyltransferase/glycogen phosphorylase [Mollisia scopiformis]